MTDNNSVPGMMYPTQKGMPAGNPRDSAIQSMNSNQESAANASKLLSGGRRKKYRGGEANSTIAVPQYQMLYEPQGGPGTNPNNQIQGNTQTSTQMAANSVYDDAATKIGGRRTRSRRGGNPDWLWGCMSGGKKHRTRRRKTKKHSRKSRKSRRSSRKY